MYNGYDVHLIDVLSKSSIGRIVADSENTPYHGMVFSRDGKHLFIAKGRSIQIFDLKSHKIRIFAYSGVTHPTTSHGGTILAAAESYRFLCFWDIGTGQLVHRFLTQLSVPFMNFSETDEFIETSSGRLDLRMVSTNERDQLLTPVGWILPDVFDGEWWVRWKGRNILYLPWKSPAQSFHTHSLHTMCSGDLFMITCGDRVMMLELDSKGPDVTANVRTLPPETLPEHSSDADRSSLVRHSSCPQLAAAQVFSGIPSAFSYRGFGWQRSPSEADIHNGTGRQKSMWCSGVTGVLPVS